MDTKDRNVEKAESKKFFVFICHLRSKFFTHAFYRQEFHSEEQNLVSKWDINHHDKQVTV